MGRFLRLTTAGTFHLSYKALYSWREVKIPTFLSVTFLMLKIPVTTTLFPGTTLSHKYLLRDTLKSYIKFVIFFLLFTIELHVPGDLTLRD
jgi:hypothetical protein